MQPGQPPVLIYVNICKLVDVYRLKQGRENSEWIKLMAPGTQVLVRIIATSTDKAAIKKHAMLHCRSFSPMPICNHRSTTNPGPAGASIITCST